MRFTGSSIFTQELLNMFLNHYVVRVQASDKPSQDEVYQFLELLVQYMKYNQDLQSKVDCSQVMDLSCQHYLTGLCAQMQPLQLSGMFWLCKKE